MCAVDPEKKREYNKRWREKNREKLKSLKQEDYQKNKLKRNDTGRKYRSKRPWVSHFTNAKQRCTNPKHPSYKYYGLKGIEFELTVEETKVLWDRDNAENMLRPSLDRRESELNYSFDNCRFVELVVNSGRKVDSQ